MKIATYNVGLLDAWLFGKKIFEFAPHTRSRASRLPSELLALDCDLLFLQELYHVADIRRVQAVLGTAFSYSFHAASASSRLSLGHGLSVFSKYPLEKLDDTRFDRQLIDEGLVGPKGFISGVVKTDELGDIFFANAHTTAGGFLQHPESKKTDRIRAQQLEQIARRGDFANSLAIIAGDLNCGPDVSTSVFLQFLGHGLTRPEVVLRHRPENEPTWDPLNPLNVQSPHKTSPPQRIDHLLLSKHLAQLAELESLTRIFAEAMVFDHGNHTLSDHYGLALTLRGALTNPLPERQ